jgi:exosortase O
MTNEENSTRQRWVAIAPLSAIGLSWLYLNLSTVQWLARSIAQMSSLNLLLLGLAGLFLVAQGIRQRLHLHCSLFPVLRPFPLALMIGSAIAAQVFRWVLTLDQLPALCFFLGSYGLLGLFLESTIWQRRLPIAIAIATVAPFSLQFSTGLGFPARILTARVVESILSGLNVSALSSEDIIVLEHGIAQVDLPCSGLKSLWVGTLFLLAVTWLEGRRIDLRWLFICLTNFVLLILANIARVLTLVILAHTFQQSAIAQILHVPLGLFGFIFACLLTWRLLKTVPKKQTISSEKARKASPVPQSHLVSKSLLSQAVLVICILGLTVLPVPSSVQARTLTLADLQLLSTMEISEVPFTEIERNFFMQRSGVEARKVRFKTQELSGSAVLVASPTWQAHHAPEGCLMASGHRIDRMERRQLSFATQGRWLSLNDGKQAAVYWFQSSKRTTAEYLDRLWGEITRQEPIWVMTSILFDSAPRPDDTTVQKTIANLNQAIARRLED